MTRFLLCTVIALLVAPLHAYAQERAANSPLSEQKISWDSLVDQVNLVTVKVDAVNTRMDKTTNCGRNGKLYAPGVSGTTIGDCFEVSSVSGKNLTTIINDISSTRTNAISLNNNINNSNTTLKTITQCGKAGQGFNGSSCITPAVKANCTLQIVSSGSSGGTCSSCNSSVKSCPSGYIKTGANGGSTHNSDYCGRVVCN